MSDADIRDQAVAELGLMDAELALTTRGLKGYVPPPTSHWGKAKTHEAKARALLAQIGAPAAGVRWFSDASPFNTPIPAAAAVRPDSAALIAGVGYPNWASGNWGRNVYEAAPEDPVIQVAVRTSWGNRGPGTFSVPMPTRALPSTNSDGHLAVIAGRGAFELWDAARDSAGWTAGSLAVWPLDGQGVWTGGTKGGVVAAGTSLLAGMLRPSELAAGRIDHALACAVKNTSPEHVPPAAGGDGKTAGGIPIGARLQWDPADDLAWLATAPQWERTIARALQTYGAFVIDTGGSWGFTTMSAVSDEAVTTPFPFGSEYAATLPGMAAKMRVLA